MAKGKVWLVGAGPGDAELLTKKSERVLNMADVIVYDALVGQAIIAGLPETAEKVYVGKRSSHHAMPQEEISRLLVSYAERGKNVVRLKGGDPFLFGRGGEEIEELLAGGIDYEVVPGITSAIAVPAYNGIPVTHRDYCSSLHIITGHKRRGKSLELDYEALCRMEGTLVFLMGVASAPEICQGLITAGMTPQMPAALLSQGTTAGQQKMLSTISELPRRMEKEKLPTPAILLIGKVCTLAEDFGWYEKLPLAGWKVLVTRPRQHISKTADLLRQKGAEVLELPSICTVPVEDNGRLYEAFEKLDTYQWIIFTSPAGVEIFFDEMDRKEMDVRSLGQAKIAVIGEGTKKKLKEHHLLADFVPDVYDGDTLGAELAKELQGNEKILIPRAEAGNKKLTELLEQTGAKVDDIATYTTCYEKSRLIDEKKELETGSVDCVVFTSASTVKGFVEGTKGLDYTKVKAACIGKQTKAAADAYGMQTCMAKKATIESLIELVEEMKQEN